MGPKMLWGSVAIGIAVLGFFGLRWIPTQSATTIRVSKEQVALYKSDNPSYPLVGHVAKGTELSVIEERNGWYLVKTTQGTKGWVTEPFQD